MPSFVGYYGSALSRRRTRPPSRCIDVGHVPDGRRSTRHRCAAASRRNECARARSRRSRARRRRIRESTVDNLTNDLLIADDNRRASLHQMWRSGGCAQQSFLFGEEKMRNLITQVKCFVAAMVAAVAPLALADIVGPTNIVIPEDGVEHDFRFSFSLSMATF